MRHGFAVMTLSAAMLGSPALGANAIKNDIRKLEQKTVEDVPTWCVNEAGKSIGCLPRKGGAVYVITCGLTRPGDTSGREHCKIGGWITRGTLDKCDPGELSKVKAPTPPDKGPRVATDTSGTILVHHVLGTINAEEERRVTGKSLCLVSQLVARNSDEGAIGRHIDPSEIREGTFYDASPNTDSLPPSDVANE